MDDDVQTAWRQAYKSIQNADHLLTQIYPALRDQKVLMAVTENLFQAWCAAIRATLAYARLNKIIPPYVDDIDSQWTMFRLRVMPHFRLEPGLVQCFQELREIVVLHKKSTVEFGRKDSYILCEEAYRMKTVSVQKLKEHLAASKQFVQCIDKIVHSHGTP